MNVPAPEPPGLLTRRLLDYWIRHPGAHGTVESIAEWWLLEQRIRQTAAEVRSALAVLAEKGYVAERRQSDGTTSYQLKREHLAEIVAWLESVGGGKG